MLQDIFFITAILCAVVGIEEWFRTHPLHPKNNKAPAYAGDEPNVAPLTLDGLPQPPAKYSLGSLGFWALGDRVLIEEDEFKSGYECHVCGGGGSVTCVSCGGDGKSKVVDGARCKECDASGTVTCPECKGKGGFIVVPDIAQRRPTTGTVVSAGLECKVLKQGDAVLYSNFAGYAMDLERAGRKVTMRILHETEVLCAMEGHLELRSMKTNMVFNG